LEGYRRVQIAAQDVGKLSRAVAGGAGLAVAAFGALTLLRPSDAVPASPSAALLPAGLALFLQVLPSRRAIRSTAYLLAAVAAAIGAAEIVALPAAAVATLLVALALVCLDVRLWRRAGDPTRYRVADPLLAGAAIIALVALVPRMFAPTFPDGHGPSSVMSPNVAGALLTLAVGAILARPETGPLRTAAAAGPGTTIRRLTPALIAVPVIAALVSALAVRTGVSRPAAAVSTGAVLAALAVLALVGYLVRSLERADRRQHQLVDELHRREEFAATLLQSMNEAVLVLDANRHILNVNRRWRELTGYDADQSLPLEPQFPPADSGDWLMPRVDGTEVPVLTTMAAIPDANGAPRAYVATYVDITDRKRAEEALTEHASELERGNARLREANAGLEAALAFKNDLTSMLTHDVAQPISSIASLSELLAADWADLGEDIRFELTTKIDKNAQRLVKMMNDLQLLFRLDTGSITAQRTPVPVLEVVEAVVATFLGECQIEVCIDEDVSALADRGHLTATVQNLLRNAVTYGQPPVEIRAHRTADTVVLVVRDHGRGIPEELVPNLFGRFMRGAGLGLFIVRHLVEANGGAVRYEPAEPCGAQLIVSFESASVAA
jgi:signal transduction histidine kinase